MPPITIHNLPVPPREVAEAFRFLNIFLVEHTALGEDTVEAGPTEMEYCAIVYDSGGDAMADRLMVIEAVDDGYPFTLTIIFRPDASTKFVAFNADDADNTEVLLK